MDFSYQNQDPSDDQIKSNLLKAELVSKRALSEGKHPFGAVLVAPDHETILLRQGNIDAVNHAESTLARQSTELYSEDFLWNCTLYTTVEPCAMCAATCYWANIGRVVFGVTEYDLLMITGNHAENPTMDLPCRDVFIRGQKPIRVFGPVTELRDLLLATHRQFWDSHV